MENTNVESVTDALVEIILWNISEQLLPEVYLGPYQTCMVELFVKNVDCYKPFKSSL